MGSDIVFDGKGYELEGMYFLSLYPEVEVASIIIDVWSIILNNEEQFRDEPSGKRHVYCRTVMLVSNTIIQRLKELYLMYYINVYCSTLMFNVV